MKTLIVSDIHANYPALRAVLNRVRRKGISRTFCLGDVVGYGASPNQVLDLLRSRRGEKIFVRGNHDRVATEKGEPENFNDAAKDAIIWSRKRLSRKAASDLASFQVGPIDSGDALLCHGSPDDEDEYLLSEAQAARIFRDHTADVMFFGHTHLPSYFVLSGELVEGFLAAPNSALKLEPEKRYLINPGSVGQPRDRDNRSAYAIWDKKTSTVRFSRIEYDYEAAGDAILSAGLPEILARRLHVGF